MGYRLKGRMLEVCTCDVVCPCWVGRDPDGGQCEGAVAWTFEEGQIDRLDVSGLTVGIVVHIPGNAMDGNWRALMFMDERASDDQEKAILEVFTGKAGGPVADFAGLIGEVAGVQRVPIRVDVSEGAGSFHFGDRVDGELERLVGATGKPTVMSDTALSTIPGSPAYCAESKRFRVDAPELGVTLDISGQNAVDGDFLFEHEV